MTELSSELLTIADRLEKCSKGPDAIKAALARLEEAANAVGKAWSTLLPRPMASNTAEISFFIGRAASRA